MPPSDAYAAGNAFLRQKNVSAYRAKIADVAESAFHRAWEKVRCAKANASPKRRKHVCEVVREAWAPGLKLGLHHTFRSSASEIKVAFEGGVKSVLQEDTATTTAKKGSKGKGKGKGQGHAGPGAVRRLLRRCCPACCGGRRAFRAFSYARSFVLSLRERVSIGDPPGEVVTSLLAVEHELAHEGAGAAHGLRVLECIWLATKRAHEGQGHAARLFAHLCLLARARRCAAVLVPSNRAAVGFWLAVGLRGSELLDASGLGGGVCASLLGRWGTAGGRKARPDLDPYRAPGITPPQAKRLQETLKDHGFKVRSAPPPALRCLYAATALGGADDDDDDTDVATATGPGPAGAGGGGSPSKRRASKSKLTGGGGGGGGSPKKNGSPKKKKKSGSVKRFDGSDAQQQEGAAAVDSALFRGADPYRYGIDQSTHIWFVVDRAAFPPCELVKRGKPGKQAPAGGGRKKISAAGGGGGSKVGGSQPRRKKSGAKNGNGRHSLKRANTCKARIAHAK